MCFRSAAAVPALALSTGAFSKHALEDGLGKGSEPLDPVG